ncbi:MAG: 7,8-dihydro-6-hydroxymethylpterin dimethyltransferase [Actinomycetota bacterium]|nr:7,8-dihydro-6-hydroxymethylpterin dimethyltransferase [Actinomycetota bacterium]
MRGMPLRGDRILRYVTAFCPACHAERPDRPLAEVARLGGYLSEAEGRVWLVRGCPTHGRIVTLYDESPEILAYLEQWTAPTKVHRPDSPGNFDPIPSAYLRGLGELQTQHTCTLLEDIAEKCNLRCPTCFTDSSPDLGGLVPVDDVVANVDQRLARENGALDVVMVSGGEPTVHPGLVELLDRILERDVTRILINTNGMRLAHDDALLAALAHRRDRVEVYLQFDGFRAATHRHHRGADVGAVKRKVVERLGQAEIFTTLTMTAALGVNDDEIGDVVRFALDTPYVGGVSIQPQFGSGRSGAIDPLDRLTHTGVLARLGPQTGGVFGWRDMTALPCSHPHCCSIGYAMRTDAGQWKSLVGMIGHEELKANLDLVSNRIADRELPARLRRLLKDSLLGLLSDQASLTHPSVPQLLRNVCDHCDLGLGTLAHLATRPGAEGRRRIRELLAHRVKRIVVKPFMDLDTMIEERLQQCCVHVGSRRDDGNHDGGGHQCAPFCAMQAWPALGRTRLSAVASAGESEPVEIGPRPAVAAAAATRP